MKKVFSLFAASLLFMSTTSLNADVSFGKKNEELFMFSDCSNYAAQVAEAVEARGGHYYHAYFNAYGYCLETMDPIAP